MAELTEAEKKVIAANADAENNGSDGTGDHSTSGDKGKSVPLATFLENEKKLKEKAQRLEVELDGIKAKQKADTDAKLIADGKLQELIDTQKSDLATKQTELDTAKTEAEESKTFKAAKVEEYKKKLGDKWNNEYGKLSLIALDALVNSMVAKADIKTDGGATGEHIEIELTADQKKDAKEKYPYATEEKAYEFHKHNLIKTGIIKPKEK